MTGLRACILPLIGICFFLLGSTMNAQESKERKLLSSLEGKWEGNCKTWLRPGELADESKVTGEFKAMPGIAVIRHTYKGSFNGKPRTGEETIAFEAPEAEFQVAWVDTFHMNYAMLFSRGKVSDKGNGFSVFSKYRVEPNQKHWGWRTVYELKDSDNLVVTAYNVTPDGEEGKAVELVYKRIK